MPRNDSINDDDFDDDDDDQTDPSQAMKQMRKRIRDLERDNKALAAVQRENAFLKAGIDTSTPLGKMFAKGYDGDLNDIAALRAEAQEVGLLKVDGTPDVPAATDTTATPPVAPAVDTSTSDRRNLATGALPDDGSGTDPKQEAFTAAEASIKAGMSYEKSAGAYIARMAEAAIKGDQRAMVQ